MLVLADIYPVDCCQRHHLHLGFHLPVAEADVYLILSVLHQHIYEVLICYIPPVSL